MCGWCTARSPRLIRIGYNQSVCNSLRTKIEGPESLPPLESGIKEILVLFHSTIFEGQIEDAMRVSLSRARKSCETVTVLSRATVNFILKKMGEGSGRGI